MGAKADFAGEGASGLGALQLRTRVRPPTRPRPVLKCDAWDEASGARSGTFPTSASCLPRNCSSDGGNPWWVEGFAGRPDVPGLVRRWPAPSPAPPRLSFQWLVGFSFFLFPGASFSLRTRYRPLHIFFGAAIFLLSVGTALLGLKEALLFKLG